MRHVYDAPGISYHFLSGGMGILFLSQREKSGINQFVVDVSGVLFVGSTEPSFESLGRDHPLLYVDGQSVYSGVCDIWTCIRSDAGVCAELVFLLPVSDDVGQIYLSVWKNHSGNFADFVYGITVCAKV